MKFLIDNEELRAASIEWVESWKVYMKACQDVADLVGAQKFYPVREGGKMLGFVFQRGRKVDEKLWRKMERAEGYAPRKNFKVNRELVKRMESLPLVCDKRLTKALNWDKPMFVNGRMISCPGLEFSPEFNTIVVDVPQACVKKWNRPEGTKPLDCDEYDAIRTIMEEEREVARVRAQLESGRKK